MRTIVSVTTALLLSAGVLSAQEVVIGAVEGPPEELFGRIADVGASDDGQIVVLDLQSPVPLAFSADGTFLGPLGRSGQGPGEFGKPAWLGVSDAGRVAIVDHGNARISLHQLSQDGVTFLSTFRVEQVIGDLCWLGDRLFAINTHGAGGGLIVEFGADGQVVNRFGARLQPEGRLAAIYQDEPPSTLNQGKMACDEDNNVIGYASTITGRTRTYSADGELRWEAVAPSWSMIQIQRTDGLCCMFGPPESGYYHQVRSVAFDGPTTVISVAVIGTDRVESFEFRSVDGAFQGVRDNVPLLADVLADGRKVGFRHLPVSQTVIWR